MALSQIKGSTGIVDATITSAKLADFSAAVDLNGVELLLDADQDTSITADTDDQIDFKIAGVEHISLTNSSGDTIIKPRVDAKDIVFQQFDGNKILEINDGNFVGIGGNATAAGQIRIYEDTDNGSHYSGFTVGNLTASVAYQLPNADGSSGQALITDGSGVLSFSTIATNTPTNADGQALGSVSLEWSDLFLADASTIQFGADQDVILTHVADTGLLLSGTNVIQFNDASQNIGAPSNRILDINATDEIELNATLVDVNANLDVSGTITSGGVITGTAFTAGSAVLAEAELELLDGLTAGTAIASKVVTTDANIDTTGIRNLTISGELDAATLDISGDIDVDGTTNLDIVDIDGAVNVAADVTIASTNKIIFNDASQFIQGASATVLDIAATDEIELNATLVDVNANLDVSGTITSGGVITGTAFTAGSAVLAEAELELLDGLTAGTAIASKVVTTDANIDSTGMRNLTISGEIDAATGDFSGAVDVAGATTTAAITASGIIKTDDATDATSTTDGSLQTDGGLSVAKDAVIGDDLLLLSDASVIKFGADSEITLTHVHDAGLILGGTTPTLTVGDGGAEDAKIIFDGNAQNFHIGLDDSGDKLTIGLGNTLGTTPGFTMDENTNVVFPDNQVTIQTTGTGDHLTLVSTNAGAGVAPNIVYYRNSSSPANDDYLGEITFRGRNNNSQDVDYGRINAQLKDVTDGSEDAQMIFNVKTAGSEHEVLRYGQGATVFNEASVDQDFRVESNDYTHAFHVNAGNNSVSTGAIERNFGLFTVSSGDSNCGNANANGDEFVIEVQNSINGGMSILTDQARTGAIIFGDQGSNSVGRIAYDHPNNRFFVDTNGNDVPCFFLNNGSFSTNGESAPDIDQGGLCLDQNAGDSQIISFKSSDIAHNITGEAESDTYFRITKGSATAGGIRMDALSEQGGEIMQFIALGNTGGGLPSTTTGTGGTGAMSFGVNLSANNDGAANDSVADAGNLAVFRNYTATQFIIKGNGAIHSNAAAGTYDSYEDAQLVRAFDLTNKKGVIASQFDKYVSYNHEALADAELVGRDEDGTPNMMMNITGFIQLHNGAIWQSYEKTEKLTRAMYDLAIKAVGKEEADKILEDNEVKLLN